MKKIISVLVLVVLLVIVTGCKQEERTYMADGTYMVWELGVQNNVSLKDSTKLVDFKKVPEDAVKKVNAPVLTTVAVTIANDKIVKWNIDERQSVAYVKTLSEQSGDIAAVSWEWKYSKKELEYGYGMEKDVKNNHGEWFLQVSQLERNWLETIPAELSTVSITHDNLVELAKKALQNAKDGKAAAIVHKEHYTYDVTFVTGDVNKEGKISNINIDAHLFGRLDNKDVNTFDPTHADYLKFDWDPETKYASYGPMTHEENATTPSWQAQIDTLVDFINENGWKGTYTPGKFVEAEWKDKTINDAGEPIEALSSVTIQLSREVMAMNMLYNFFPTAW